VFFQNEEGKEILLVQKPILLHKMKICAQAFSKDHLSSFQSGMKHQSNLLSKCRRNLSVKTSVLKISKDFEETKEASATVTKDFGIAAKATFHKRPLPDSLISLSSKNGKIIFSEALASGGMESYFSLAEQFVTQSEPSYCALSSLAMVLNALNFDPKKVWKGAWRWVSEETLQCETQICGHSLEKVGKFGMNFDEFESLARCHGIRIRAYKNNEINLKNECNRDLNEFRSYVETVCGSDKSESFIVANFSRQVLGQTGDGHFSPLGGYHKGKDLVLIMDVARFKYPPYWVPLEVLWESMAVHDISTKSSRGYFILSTWNSNSLNNVDSNPNLEIETNSEEINVKKTLDNNTLDNNVFNHSLFGDCPPIIKTWQEFRKNMEKNNKITCSECHRIHHNT
jgi:glutathione gamma-glutamylcysteinyltransferase